MVKIKKLPIWENEAEVKIWFNDTKYWWDFHGSKIVISSTDTFETKEEAIKYWNNFCDVLMTLYKKGYSQGYYYGYEKGWRANG